MLRPRALICILAAAAAASASVAAEQTVPAPALAVVDRYFAALGSGDVDDLSTVLGGSLERKRQRLLRNPEHARALARASASWDFRVLDQALTDSGLVVVDFEMRREPAEVIRKRLYVAPAEGGDAPGYEIVQEQVIP